LERNTCNFLNAYYVVKKHSLFECKTGISIKLVPQLLKKQQKECEVLSLKQDLYQLDNYLETLKKLSNNKSQAKKPPMSEI